MANQSQEAVEALAAAVAERRAYLGRSQVDVWKRGGPSNSTMTSIESAASLSVTPSTLKKLDAGLDWTEGTALRVLLGELPPATAVRDPKYDRRTLSEAAESRPIYRATSSERAEPSRGTAVDYSGLIAAIAVDADDIHTTARNIDTMIDTDVSDPDDVESLIYDVETLISDVDDLVAAIAGFVETIDQYAKLIVGPAKLQRLKNETLRFRRQQTIQREGPGLLDEVAPEMDAVDPAAGFLVDAARTVPPGYQKGQAEQGEAADD